MTTVPANIIESEGFRIFHFECRPPVLEAAVVFDADHFSQKLVFQLMDITHRHGLACSAPQFGKALYEGKVIFCVRSIMPSSRSLRKYLKRMVSCLSEISAFHSDFLRQMDFTTLDISMFCNSPVEIDPSLMAAVRDQHYGGSWDAFKKDMEQESREEEADAVERCRLFEAANGKDIALVGGQLEYMLSILDEIPETERMN